MNRVERKQQTRQNLIDAALRLSAEKGFEQISIREMTAICDLTPPAFYRHFESLEELGVELLDEVSENLRHLLHEIWSGITLGPESIEKSLTLFFSFVLAHKNQFKLFRAQRYGSSLMFQNAIRKELRLFVTTLANDLQEKKIFNKRAEMIAEIIVSIVFTRGLEVIDTVTNRQEALKQRVLHQITFIIRAQNR